MAHHPPLNIYAIGAMGSVVAIYAWIKSPLKYKWAAENRLSPKADLAWREGFLEVGQRNSTGKFVPELKFDDVALELEEAPHPPAEDFQQLQSYEAERHEVQPKQEVANTVGDTQVELFLLDDENLQDPNEAKNKIEPNSCVVHEPVLENQLAAISQEHESSIVPAEKHLKRFKAPVHADIPQKQVCGTESGHHVPPSVQSV